MLVQGCFVLGKLLAGLLKVGYDLAVIVHHFVYKIHPGQEVGKVGGLENHRPIGNRAPLLLLSHLLAEQLVLIRLLRLRLAELLLGLLDERFILRDLLLGVGDLR
mgnify:CR=1 FL=1